MSIESFARGATLALAALLVAPIAAAAPEDGLTRTGSAIQTASHWPFTIELFAVWHAVKTPPEKASRRAMIDLDVDKRLAFKMLRDIPADKLASGFRDAYRRGGWEDTAAVERFLAPLVGTLPKDKAMWITYESKTQTTRLVVDGGASSQVVGAPFMKATWGLWFGTGKLANVGDQLAGTR